MNDWMVLCGLSISSVIGYLIGKSKGKPDKGAIAGFFLGPVGWLLIIISPDDSPKCPYCRENVARGAIRCKGCTARIPRCSACKKQLGATETVACGSCGVATTGDEWG